MIYLSKKRIPEVTKAKLKSADILTIERIVSLSMAELKAIKGLDQNDIHDIMELLVLHYNLSMDNDLAWCKRFAAHTVDKHIQKYLKELDLLDGDKFFFIPLSELLRCNIDAWVLMKLSYLKGKPDYIVFDNYSEIMDYRECHCGEEIY